MIPSRGLSIRTKCPAFPVAVRDKPYAMGAVHGELRGSRAQASLAFMLTLAIVPFGCRGQANRGAAYAHRPDPNTTRYRLLLRENPVDPGDAFRCYGACQAQHSPRGYLDCLQTCPGFEITEGEYCSPGEVPPIAACFTARRIPATSEPPKAAIVLAVVGSFLLVIAADSLCASSSSHCGYYAYPPR
jgi:hypothetical protein